MTMSNWLSVTVQCELLNIFNDHHDNTLSCIFIRTCETTVDFSGGLSNMFTDYARDPTSAFPASLQEMTHSIQN